MAVTALHAAASGMKALDTKLNVLANNLANVNTVGFKRSRTNFEDLLYLIARQPGLQNADDRFVPHGIQLGLGTQVSGTQLDFAQGSPDPTGRALDLTIEGDGFFRVLYNDGGQEVTAYTRAGNFTRNSQGEIVLGNSIGSRLDPGITIPDTAAEIQVSPNGLVQYRELGQPNMTEAGQIQLSRFVNPEGLRQIGKNLYLVTDASGDPVDANPGEQGAGTILSGNIEMSNVDPVRELVQLILTQRGFELNSQTVKSADEALQTVSNLRRF
ncbi:MAG: flagellar basal-body rod protein FlgG [Phycisphaerae bacterium]|nr:flagellar basal-body rod protein FlgG [Phycisphaerae bacterium]